MSEINIRCIVRRSLCALPNGSEKQLVPPAARVAIALASLLLDDAFLVVPLQILGADVAERAQYGVRMFA